METRQLVHEALGDLTRAVNALDDALRAAGVIGDAGAGASGDPNPTESADSASGAGVPFVPILIPMDVLRAWAAIAPGGSPAGAGPVPGGDTESGDGVAAPNGPAPGSIAASAPLGGREATPAGESTPPARGTWVWTWEHPTSEGERVAEESEGDR